MTKINKKALLLLSLLVSANLTPVLNAGTSSWYKRWYDSAAAKTGSAYTYLKTHAEAASEFVKKHGKDGYDICMKDGKSQTITGVVLVAGAALGIYLIKEKCFNNKPQKPTKP